MSWCGIQTLNVIKHDRWVNHEAHDASTEEVPECYGNEEHQWPLHAIRSSLHVLSSASFPMLRNLIPPEEQLQVQRRLRQTAIIGVVVPEKYK